MSSLVETTYGFIWDSIAVERCCSDPKGGYVLTVFTEHEAIEIRATPKGTKLVATPRKVYQHEKDHFQLARSAGVIQ